MGAPGVPGNEAGLVGVEGAPLMKVSMEGSEGTLEGGLPLPPFGLLGVTDGPGMGAVPLAGSGAGLLKVPSSTSLSKSEGS